MGVRDADERDFRSDCDVSDENNDPSDDDGDGDNSADNGDKPNQRVGAASVNPWRHWEAVVLGGRGGRGDRRDNIRWMVSGDGVFFLYVGGHEF